jgi:hypothetical protein
MNSLELLPKCIDYKGDSFFLRVWVTAWGRLAVGYKQLDGDKTILSYVVEKEKEKYIPKIIEETETSGINEHIGNCKTLDECITAMIYKINEMTQNGEMRASYGG